MKHRPGADFLQHNTQADERQDWREKPGPTKAYVPNQTRDPLTVTHHIVCYEEAADHEIVIHDKGAMLLCRFKKRSKKIFKSIEKPGKFVEWNNTREDTDRKEDRGMHFEDLQNEKNSNSIDEAKIVRIGRIRR